MLFIELNKVIIVNLKLGVKYTEIKRNNRWLLVMNAPLTNPCIVIIKRINTKSKNQAFIALKSELNKKIHR